jgi:hypothetical protein
VTWAGDYTEEWENKKKEREQFFTNSKARKERAEAIVQAIEIQRRKR